ncbi:MAG: RluA family pseudouridine synthase [Pseudomonadota bacterium]
MENSLPPPAPVRVILPDGVPPRLDKALALAVPEDLALSRSRLQALIAAGAVRRAGVVLTNRSDRVAPGDVLEITLPPPEPTDAQPEAIPLEIIYEDDGLIVVDKPVGMVVHPAPGAPSGTLVNALLHHCGDGLKGIGGSGRPGIVHRIDKETSGLLVVAKTDRVHQGLSEQFAAHSVDRMYQALLWGRPAASDPRLAGTPGVSFEPGQVVCIDRPIGRHPADRKKMAVRSDGRRAVTRLAVAEGFGPRSAPVTRVECRLETGRTHQIRVHCASIGHPILGDPTYGSGRKVPNWAAGPVAEALATLSGQALHAAHLGFFHPERQIMMQFSSNPPESFNDLLTALHDFADSRTDGPKGLNGV